MMATLNMHTTIEEASLNNIIGLPPELLSKIFTYFTLEDQVELLQKVCPLWQDVICHLIKIKKYLCFSPTVQKLVNDSVSVFSSVKYLRVDIGSPSISNLDGLASLFHTAKQIDGLHVNMYLSTGYFSDLRVTQVLDCFMNLQSPLSSVKCEISSGDVFAIGQQSPASWLAHALFTHISHTSSTSLKHLTYKHFRLYFGGGNLLESVRNFSNLETLDLTGCHLLVSRNKLAESVEFLPRLRHLDIRRTRVPVNDKLVSSIGRNCPNIEYLGLSSTLDASLGCVNSFIDGATHLQTLVFHKCHVNVNNLEVAILLLSLASEFNVLGVWHLSEIELLALADSHIGKLHTMMFAYSHSITDDILKTFAMKMPHIKELKLLRCFNLTSKGVADIVMSLPMLENIGVQGIQNIDETLLFLLRDIRRDNMLHINAYDTSLHAKYKDTNNTCLYTGADKKICVTWEKK